MTLREALRQRIPRVRNPIWITDCYLRLPLLANEQSGPWAELYDDYVQKDILNILPGSQRICVLLDDATDYEAYAGPISEYEQHEENFSRVYVEE